MRISGQRTDGALLLSIGGGLGVILLGAQSSRVEDVEMLVRKFGPWADVKDSTEMRLAAAKQLSKSKVQPTAAMSLRRLDLESKYPPGAGEATRRAIDEGRQPGERRTTSAGKIQPGDTLLDAVGRPLIHVTDVYDAQKSGYKVLKGIAARDNAERGVKAGDPDMYPVGHKSREVTVESGHDDHPQSRAALGVDAPGPRPSAWAKETQAQRSDKMKTRLGRADGTNYSGLQDKPKKLSETGETGHRYWDGVSQSWQYDLESKYPAGAGEGTRRAIDEGRSSSGGSDKEAYPGEQEDKWEQASDKQAFDDFQKTSAGGSKSGDDGWRDRIRSADLDTLASELKSAEDNYAAKMDSDDEDEAAEAEERLDRTKTAHDEAVSRLDKALDVADRGWKGIAKTEPPQAAKPKKAEPQNRGRIPKDLEWTPGWRDTWAVNKKKSSDEETD